MAILRIKTGNIINNFRIVENMCRTKGIELVPVTKVCRSDARIIRLFQAEGVRLIADSMFENLQALPDTIGKILLKVRLSVINRVLTGCDYFYVSELKILEALGALAKNRRAQVFLALELGDMREGILPEDLPDFLQKALKIKGIKICGVAANFGCLMGALPDNKVLEVLEETLLKVETEQKFTFPVVSFGGTAVYPFLQGLEKGSVINQARMGEALFFGNNMTTNRKLEGLSTDTFTVQGEILEIKEKRISREEGTYGLNAFGKPVEIENKGIRKQAILDFGELCAPREGLSPSDLQCRITGSTHDYMAVDISDSERHYAVGDFLEFNANYNSAAYAIVNPEVQKVYV